jgi:hypothetical protein
VPKISVSLSDELKAKLDDKIAQSGEGLSEVVQAALEAYLTPAVPTPAQPKPTPAPIPPPPAPVPQASLQPDFAELQDYLAACSVQQEQLRMTVCGLYEFAQANGFLAPPPPAGICPPEQLRRRLH